MQRNSLLELTTSGRHRGYSLWLLTQSYSPIPKNLRQQAKAILVWYPKERADLNLIRDENNVLTNDELVIVVGVLSQKMHVYTYEINILVDLRY